MGGSIESILYNRPPPHSLSPEVRPRQADQQQSTLRLDSGQVFLLLYTPLHIVITGLLYIRVHPPAI